MNPTISCVLMIPSTMQALANTLIDEYGFGPNNLSVALVKTSDSSAWYGCHTWCDQDFLDFIQQHQATDFLNAMVVSAVPGGVPYTNWMATLTANGMTLVPEEN